MRSVLCRMTIHVAFWGVVTVLTASRAFAATPTVLVESTDVGVAESSRSAYSELQLLTNLFQLHLKLPRAQAFEQAQGLQSTLTAVFTQAVEKASTGLEVDFEVDTQGRLVRRISDGLAFYSRLLDPSDVRTRIAVEARLLGADHLQSSDRLVKLVTSLIRDRRKSRLFEIGPSSPGERASLERLARAFGMRNAVGDDFALFGADLEFFLLREVLTHGDSLTDKDLRHSFRRHLRHLSRNLIPVVTDYFYGSIAYYSPGTQGDSVIGVSSPVRASTNVFIHEAMHSRFDRFMSTLMSWAKSKGYAIPFEIDGPRPMNAPLAGFAGLMNLLNEVNSFRAGNAFDGPVDDKQILEVLALAYRDQAGSEAVDFFNQAWPIESLHKRSVGALILGRVRELNSLSNEKMIEFGVAALTKDSIVDQINFLRLVEVRLKSGSISANSPLAVAARELVDRIRTESGHAQARHEATARFVSSQTIFSAQNPFRRTSISDFDYEARKWMEGIVFNSGGVTRPGPSELSEGSLSVLLFAASKWNLTDYDSVLGKLRELHGADAPADSATERASFTRYLSAEGTSVEARIRKSLVSFFEQDPSVLLSAFLAKPADPGAFRSLDAEAHRLGRADLVRLLTGLLQEKDRAASGQIRSILTKLFFLQGFQELPIESKAHVKRVARPDHWIAQVVDEALSNAFFSGRDLPERKKLTELIQKHFLPEELPFIRSGALKHLNLDPPADRRSRLAAKLLLLPPMANAPSAWGADLSRAVLMSRTSPATAKVDALNYIELFANSLFETSPLARSALGVRFTSVGRDEALAEFERLPEADRRQALYLKRVVWHFLRYDGDPLVRRAAVYAIVSNPWIFASLDEEIAKAMASAPEPVKASLRDLVSMADTGFLPAVERLAPILLRPSGSDPSGPSRSRPMPRRCGDVFAILRLKWADFA